MCCSRLQRRPSGSISQSVRVRVGTLVRTGIPLRRGSGGVAVLGCVPLTYKSRQREPSSSATEQALISVVATSYLLGVSTRRVDKLVDLLGIKDISKSQVSRMSGSGRPGHRVPGPGLERGPVLVRLDGRPEEDPCRRPDRQRSCPGRHRRECRWADGTYRLAPGSRWPSWPGRGMPVMPSGVA